MSFIAPVADGNSVDLAGRRVLRHGDNPHLVEAQSKALSDAAAEILAQPKVERRYVPLTSAEAVIRYAGDSSSWAGAKSSIDLSRPCWSA